MLLSRAFRRAVGGGGTMLRWRLGEVQRFAFAVFEEHRMPPPMCPAEIWYQLFRETDEGAVTALDEEMACRFVRHVFAHIVSFHAGSPDARCAGFSVPSSARRCP